MLSSSSERKLALTVPKHTQRERERERGRERHTDASTQRTANRCYTTGRYKLMGLPHSHGATRYERRAFSFPFLPVPSLRLHWVCSEWEGCVRVSESNMRSSPLFLDGSLFCASVKHPPVRPSVHPFLLSSPFSPPPPPPLPVHTLFQPIHNPTLGSFN